jgi:hypothetical protein
MFVNTHCMGVIPNPIHLKHRNKKSPGQRPGLFFRTINHLERRIYP